MGSSKGASFLVEKARQFNDGVVSAARKAQIAETCARHHSKAAKNRFAGEALCFTLPCFSCLPSDKRRDPGHLEDVEHNTHLRLAQRTNRDHLRFESTSTAGTSGRGDEPERIWASRSGPAIPPPPPPSPSLPPRAPPKRGLGDSPASMLFTTPCILATASVLVPPGPSCCCGGSCPVDVSHVGLCV